MSKHKSFRETDLEEIDSLLETEIQESTKVWQDLDSKNSDAIWNYGRYYVAINLRLWLSDTYPDDETFNKSDRNPPLESTDKDRSGHVWPLEQDADSLVSWVDDDISLHEVHAILEWLEDHDCLNAQGQAFSTVFWQEYLEGDSTDE